MGDYLSSTSLVLDSAGSVVQRTYYKPYGEVAWSWSSTGGVNNSPSTTTSLTSMGYTGQRLDQESGLMYYGARFYDPALSFFVSTDPATLTRTTKSMPRGWDRYSYVLNNPLRYNDPTGYEAEDLAVPPGMIPQDPLAGFLQHFTPDDLRGAWGEMNGTYSYHESRADPKVNNPWQHFREVDETMRGLENLYYRLARMPNRTPDQEALMQRVLEELARVDYYLKTGTAIAEDKVAKAAAEIKQMLDNYRDKDDHLPPGGATMNSDGSMTYRSVSRINRMRGRTKVEYPAPRKPGSPGYVKPCSNLASECNPNSPDPVPAPFPEWSPWPGWEWTPAPAPVPAPVPGYGFAPI